MQSASDHEVDYQEQIVLKTKDNPLAKPEKRHNLSAYRGLQRWSHRAQKEWVQQSNALNRLVEHAGFKLLDVDDDIRKLRPRVDGR